MAVFLDDMFHPSTADLAGTISFYFGKAAKARKREAAQRFQQQEMIPSLQQIMEVVAPLFGMRTKGLPSGLCLAMIVGGSIAHHMFHTKKTSNLDKMISHRVTVVTPDQAVVSPRQAWSRTVLLCLRPARDTSQ